MNARCWFTALIACVLLAAAVPALAPLAGCARPATAADGDTLAARRAKLDAMTPDQKAELTRRYERYMQLDEAERQRLSELAREIDAQPDAAELRQVASSYHQWLLSLAPEQRADLAARPADERAERVVRERRRQLEPAELDKMVDTIARQLKDQDFIPEQQRNDLGSQRGSVRRATAVNLMQEDSVRRNVFAREELRESFVQEIVKSLSEPKQAAWEAASKEENGRREQFGMFRNWMRQATAKYGTSRPPPSWVERFSPADRERFEKIQSLPPGEREAEFRKFFEERRRRFPSGDRGPGRGDGRPDGPDGRDGNGPRFERGRPGDGRGGPPPGGERRGPDGPRRPPPDERRPPPDDEKPPA